MALLIPDEKFLVLHHKNLSLNSKQMQQAIILDQWRHLQLMQPYYFRLEVNNIYYSEVNYLLYWGKPRRFEIKF